MATVEVLKALFPGPPVGAYDLGCENATSALFVSRYVGFIVVGAGVISVFSWTVCSRKSVVNKKITV